jgi:hypothetical protein
VASLTVTLLVACNRTLNEGDQSLISPCALFLIIFSFPLSFIGVAKKLADAFGVTLGSLVGSNEVPNIL